MSTVRELAWLAGLFEGEGCISLGHQGRPNLRIGMTDEDVIRRAHRIAGVGHVKAAAAKTGSGKTMWVFSVGRCDEAVGLLETLFVFFGERRQARAIEVIESYKANPLPKRLRTHCKRGHPLTGSNLHTFTYTGMYGDARRKRSCMKCQALSQKRYRERKRLRAAEVAAGRIFTLA